MRSSVAERTIAPISEEGDSAGSPPPILEEALQRIPGSTHHRSRFGPEPALWLHGREIAHLHKDRSIDIRLTRTLVRRLYSDLRTDPRISFRQSTGADWIEARCQTFEDEDFCLHLIELAGEANEVGGAIHPTRSTSTRG
jgi:hypothetical protein